MTARPARALPTRVYGALLRRSGHQMMVPKATIGSQEYAQRFSGTWHIAYPAMGRVARKPPVQYGRRTADFESPVDPVPELGVLEFERGYAVGLEGWLVTPEGQVLPEHTWYGTHADDLQKWLRPIRHPHRVERLRGSVLAIGTRSAGRNYGHFLLDSVGRLALLEKAGMRVDQFDHVVGAVPSERAKEVLRRAGVPLDRFVPTREGVAYQADVLYAPTFPGSRRNYLPWLVEFLRRLNEPQPEPSGRRLYIQRTVTRRVLNESELLPLLEQYGFELYDPGEHEDPRADFAAASVVVGPHGAGLADLAFCRPGTSVLELIAEDHVIPYWYTLAEAGGLRYGYLIGDAHPTPKSSSSSDLSVDVDEFHVALADTVGAARGPR